MQRLLGRLCAAILSVFTLSVLYAAPVPSKPEAKLLVDGLGSQSMQVRLESFRGLQGRPDALPWLRKASRAGNSHAASFANQLLAAQEMSRQRDVAAAIGLAIRENRIDMFVEWHHYWNPEMPDDIWSIHDRPARAGLELYAKRYSPGRPSSIEQRMEQVALSGTPRFYDFMKGRDRPKTDSGVWYVRASHLDSGLGDPIAFASVTGEVRGAFLTGVQYCSLADVLATSLHVSFLSCDGDLNAGFSDSGKRRAIGVGQSVVVCRGNVYGIASECIILAEGDVDLSESVGPKNPVMRNSLIRAGGEIRLPKGVDLFNCTIEPHAKSATAPYRFFELNQVGLSVVDDEEGMVVSHLKADTPFGNCGLARGDVILSIDGIRAGHSEEFRTKVRRAIVRQGDCLITVARGSKTLDLPVFFPLLK